MRDRLGCWVAQGCLLGGVALGVVSACGDSSSNEGDSISGRGGAGQSGSAAMAGASTTGGSGVAGGGAPQGGNTTAGGPQGGLGGTSPAMTDGGVAGDGDPPGHAGMPPGGAQAGGAGGEAAQGGSGEGGSGEGGSGEGGSGGASEQCDSTAVAQPRTAACAVAPSVTQQYRVGLATEQLSFGVRLRATGYFGFVHVNEIEVHYYYSQEETSGFQATVDSYVLQPGGIDLTASSEISIVELDPHQRSSSGPGCQTHFIRIRNTSPLELVPATPVDTYAELHVTLTPQSAALPNQNHADDHSYDPEATDWEQTSVLGVYHCGSLTSGCTPGDAGTCD